MPTRRVLYAGDDAALPWLLKDPLKRLDCVLVRAPAPVARMFLQSNIEYSLFLFDADPTGAELEAYARTLPHREHTPVLLVKKTQGIDSLVRALTRLLRR
ncbi:MAG: hypothetical protein JOZ96_14355 [Acidobacteria bacterium]|nr:hypothetical protein [Acidobacteriota bacterium]